MFNLNEKQSSRIIEIQNLSYFLKKSFESLKMLNNTQEKSLLEIFTKVEYDIKEIRANSSDFEQEHLESFISNLHGEELTVLDEMERLQRYSLLLTTFAFFESKLKELCNEIERDIDFRVKLNDLNKNKGDLFKYWTFLVKIFGVNGVRLEKSFNVICQHKKIRNAISHSDGVVPKKDSNFLKDIKFIKIVEFEDNYLVSLQKDYLEYLINEIELFTDDLLEEIVKKYTEILN